MANNDNKKVGFKLAGLKKLLKTIKDDINSKEPALPAKINSKYLHTDSSGNLEWSEVDLSAKEDIANKTDSYQVNWEKWSINTITTHTDVVEESFPLSNIGNPVYVSRSAPTIKLNGKFDTSGFEMMEAYRYDNYERERCPYLLMSQASESDFYYYISYIVDMGGWYEYGAYKHVVQTTTTQEKGTTQYADVSSTNVNAYPQNGEQDGYWYVFKASSYGSTEYTSKKALIDGLGTKQSTLVSGVNIKTVNNNSILGEGNLDIVPNIVGTSNPTTSTAGYVGQLYTNTITNVIFQCTAISGSTYTWISVGGASKEDVSNKVTSITSASTNIQYPSALATYTAINAKEDKGMITVDGTEYVAKSLFCNRNLLDNPWFTINQRGQNSYNTNNAYTVDRWKLNNSGGNGSISVGSSGITFNSGSELSLLQQSFESVLFADGTTFTVSAIIDGIVYSATVSTNAYTKSVLTSDVAINTSIGSGYLQIEMQANKSHIIKAVKLELGTISTLANDSAPDYTTELLKCQRYFYKITSKDTYSRIMLCVGDGTYAVGVYHFPVDMRMKPIVEYNGSVYLYTNGAGNILPVTNVGILTEGELTSKTRTVVFYANGIVAGTIYAASLSTNAYISFLADL